MGKLKIDRAAFNRAANDVKVETVEFLEEQLGEASQEVREFVKRNGAMLLRARLAGRKDLENRLFEQLKMLGEVQRLRANAAMWKVAESAMRRFLSFAVKALIAL